MSCRVPFVLAQTSCFVAVCGVCGVTDGSHPRLGFFKRDTATPSPPGAVAIPIIKYLGFRVLIE